MANMNIRTPVFYPDRIRHQRGRGGAIASIITGSDLIDFQTGSISTLHNGKPLDLCTFNTSASSFSKLDHVLFNYNMGTDQWRTTFITILNHNLHSCNGKFRIFVGSSADEINDVNGASALENSFSAGTDDEGNPEGVNYTPVEVVNADSIVKSSNGKSIHVHPSSDGTTIIKIVKTSDSSDFTGFRFIGIQFEGDSSSSDTSSSGSFNTTDLTLGGIEIGEVYTMPVSPDLNVKRSIIYDKTSIQESLGGQRYATKTSTGRTATTTSKSPFTTSSYSQYVFGGRIAYDLSFSYLQSSDIMPTEYGIIDYTNDSFVQDVWNMTDGNLHPFVFSIDSASTGSNAESEFIYARFAQDSLEMDQVAPDVFNISLKIEEEF
jgi:hypothetical protein|tara:strand:- start:5901 stop:7031 length:1131 start_codon:yes stop_codon:yes gene_type:complete